MAYWAVGSPSEQKKMAMDIFYTHLHCIHALHVASELSTKELNGNQWPIAKQLYREQQGRGS